MIGNSSDNPNTELGHFYLSGGVKIPVTADEEWVIEPSFLMKSSDMFFKAFQADLTTRVYFRQDYWAGLSYRTQDALIFLLGFTYDRYYFAYAFDYALSDISKYTYGSHELSFAVKFGDNARRYRWLNRY
jgi:type IX secretion system PorP/SprF family membrane protein